MGLCLVACIFLFYHFLPEIVAVQILKLGEKSETLPLRGDKSEDASQSLETAFIEEQVGDPLFSIAGYVPESTPFSNPSTLAQPISIIPSAPDCVVRPQTIVEIQRMRAQSLRIAQLIDQEVVVMGKRKAYVEQMTEYLNDRIRELNKVKAELADELRWIQVSQNKIRELQEKEKLVKLQDILSCLNQDTTSLEGEKSVKAQTITQLQSESSKVQAKITEIKAAIDVGGDAAPAAAAAPAPAAAPPPAAS